MKYFALILSISLGLVACANAAPVVFIVRHAEKASTSGKDPDLSVEGQKRADALAHILKDSQITSIFVTEFKRTQQTAAPTAKAARVTPTVVPANDIGALVEKLRALNGNALVAHWLRFMIGREVFEHLLVVALSGPDLGRRLGRQLQFRFTRT